MLHEGTKALAIATGMALAAGNPVHGSSTRLTPPHVQDIRIWNEALVIPNGGMVRPELVAYVTPAYTDEARQHGVAGVASFRVVFDIDGNFQILSQLGSLGFGLDESARQALLQWRFLPAYQSGRRVSVISQIDVVLTPEDQVRMINHISEGFSERGLRTRLELPDGSAIVAGRVWLDSNGQIPSGQIPQVRISAVR